MVELKTLDTTQIPGLNKAVRQLAEQMRDAAGAAQPILVYDHEAPFAFLALPLAAAALPPDPTDIWPPDAEMLALSFDPKFQAAIAHAREQARRGLGIPAEEVDRRLGITDAERDKYLRRRRRARTQA